MRVALVHRDLHQSTRGGICTLYLPLAEELAARIRRHLEAEGNDPPDPSLWASILKAKKRT